MEAAAQLALGRLVIVGHARRGLIRDEKVAQRLYLGLELDCCRQFPSNTQPAPQSQPTVVERWGDARDRSRFKQPVTNLLKAGNGEA